MLRPGSKLSTLGWWDDTTLGADLGVAGAGRDEVYAAMDWLLARQDAIEATVSVTGVTGCARTRHTMITTIGDDPQRSAAQLPGSLRRS
ncbi:MAG: hypothetical protein ACRDS0_31135 [Pseudonocardiaceae bacterium]